MILHVLLRVSVCVYACLSYFRVFVRLCERVYVCVYIAMKNKSWQL